MAERRKAPGIFTWLAIALLVGPLVFAGWYFSRPKPPDKNPIAPEDLDVLCTGRVDTPKLVIALDPAQPGRVLSVSAEEGKEVKINQEILRLDDSIAQNRLQQAQSAVKLAEVDRDRAKLDAERFPNQLKAREALVEAAGQQVIAAEKGLEGRKALSGVSKPGEAELAVMEAQVNQLKEFKKSEDLQLADLKKMKTKLMEDAAEARLSAAQADLALARKAVDDCVISAPGPGILLRLQANKGGMLMPGYTPSIVFAPAGKLIVRAEVDQEFLGKVKVGQAAIILDDSRIQSPTWNGKVLSISRWVAQRRAFILDPGEINDVRTLECVIELDNDDDLVIGQRMRVRIKMRP